MAGVLRVGALLSAHGSDYGTAPMTATLVGPGGVVEIDNSDAVPIEVSIVGGIVFPATVEVANDVGNPLPVTGEVALDAATLAALEQISVLIAAGQEIGLSAATLAALETISVHVLDGTVELGSATLAALEQVTVSIAAGQEVALSAATLAALEAVTATVDNFPADFPDAAAEAILASILAALSATLAVGVVNFPVDYPLPAGQVTTLTPQTDALTDAELRATPVPVTFPADESGLTDAQLRATPVPVSALDLDIRDLDYLTDDVRAIDAAETSGLTWQTISFATAGANTIVVVAPGQRLRIRRFLLTTASVPDVLGDPVLTITHGGHSLRTQALIGRFDILGDDGQDLVITSSKTGQIDGSVAYSLEAV